MSTTTTMTDKEFLLDLKDYIENTEVTIDAEWGNVRTLEELISAGLMPETYTEVLRRLDTLDGSQSDNPQAMETMNTMNILSNENTTQVTETLTSKPGVYVVETDLSTKTMQDSAFFMGDPDLPPVNDKTGKPFPVISPSDVDKYINIIKPIVNDAQGIKGTELAFKVTERFYSVFGSKTAVSFNFDVYSEILDMLVKTGEIVEIEYLLPNNPNRIKSFYLPAGTNVSVMLYSGG